MDKTNYSLYYSAENVIRSLKGTAMYSVVMAAHDVTYFEEKYQVVVDPETGQKPGSFTLNTGLQFYGVVGCIKETPSDCFEEREIIDAIILNEQVAATVVARALGDDGRPDVSTVVCSGASLGKEGSETLLDQMHNHAEILAQLSGRSIGLVIEDGKTVPATGSARVLKIALGSPAPGPHGYTKISELFDLSVCERGYTIRVPTPSTDMGPVVKNDQDESIAQIVGDTIYLFLPLHESCFGALSDTGGKIFQKALTLAWNAYVKESTKPASFQVQRRATLSEVTTHTLDIKSKQEQLQSDIDRAEDAIQDAQRKLASAMALKRSLLMIKRGFAEIYTIDPAAAWDRLTGCAYFDHALVTSDERFHYITKPLEYEHTDGSMRYLGRYGLRLSGFDSVAVWSLDYPHPSGIIHPHVNQYGDICLGNITESVTQLLLEFRETDAAVLVMRLLAEGYDAGLADHPIEEWPTIEQYQRRKQR